MAAGAIGNVLEWYDFALYGYFAATIGRTFFPHEDSLAQLLSAYGIFAVGFVVRPLGGIVVGHIGDRFGRAHRPHRLGVGDGDPDLPDRPAARLSDARESWRRCCSPSCAWCRACRSAAN